jgi:hypothetical protein
MLRVRWRASFCSGEVSMRDVSESRGARAIGFALAVSLVMFEAALVAGTGAFGVPGVVLVRFSGAGNIAQAVPGGETVVSKLAEAARALGPATSLAPEPSGEPSLVGLADKVPWEREQEAQATQPGPKVKAFAESSLAAADVLPWDAAEPFTPGESADAPAPKATALETEGAISAPQPPSAELPPARDVETWVKGKATQFNSEERGRGRLFHFELWLEPPAKVKERLVAVAYAFDTPAVMPQAQVSNDQKTGFRVAFGGLACADKVTLTLKFKDGQSQQVAVDGCRLLS